MNARILLVEDYADAREMYRDYLAYAGFDVHTADNGKDAIETARRVRPDLILMDLSLPVLDGWEATRRLKADKATAAITVIALSAHAMVIERQRAAQAGCDGFIAKPCLPEQLVEELARYLQVEHPVARRKLR